MSIVKNIETSLKNFLGLSQQEIKTLRRDTGKLCPQCKNRSTRNWALLIPCKHKVCFTCLDNLYDYYIISDITTMFECPFCNTNVKDWELVSDDSSTEFTIKIVDQTNDPSKLCAFMIQQVLLYQELIPTEEAVRDDDLNSPNYGNWMLFGRKLPDPINETSEILSRIGISDLIIAYEECKSVGFELIFRVHLKTIWDLEESMNMDSYFIDLTKVRFKNIGYDYKAIVIIRKGMYLGHLWYFTHPFFPNFVGIYGIKSSIVNMLTKLAMGDECPSYRQNIPYRLLQEAEKMAKDEGRKTLIVPWPSPAMCLPLIKSGFTEVNTCEEIPEKSFLDLSGMDMAFSYCFKDL